MSTLGSIDPVRIEGNRIALRSPCADDAPRMLRYEVDNREHFRKVSPLRGDEYFALSHWKQQIRLLEKAREAGMIVRLLLSYKNDPEMRIVGQCCLSNIQRGPFQAAHLGYGLASDEVGKGLMYEALTMALEYAFEVLNLHRVMANYMPDNHRSGRLLKRLGFVTEGRAADYLRINGEWEDHVLTSRINPAWVPTGSDA